MRYMKRFLLASLSLLMFFTGIARNKDSVIHYIFPDSLRATGFLAHIHVQKISSRKEVVAGIQTGDVKLSLEAEKNEREISFEFPESAIVVAKGIDVETDGKGELEWDYNWSINETYHLYIASISDSAGNFTLYSGYIFFPGLNKWKLIGTCKVNGQWGAIKNGSAYFSATKKNPLTVSFNEAWVQRSNGSWKNLQQTMLKAPLINPQPDIDSVKQSQIDKGIIQQAISSGKTDAGNQSAGIYYTIMKEGTGRLVSIADTVVVFYKGYLLSDGTVFDETKDKPASFPLSRLIKGWQLALPLCKVGGKIKIVIPSGLAYSIRTRAAKIPPNSNLVFEIEVTDVK